MVKRVPVPKCDCGRPSIAFYDYDGVLIHVCEREDQLMRETLDSYNEFPSDLASKLTVLISYAATNYGMTEIPSDSKLINTVFAEVSRHNQSVLPFQIKTDGLFLKCEGLDSLIAKLEKEGVLIRQEDKYKIVPQLPFFWDCCEYCLWECAKELAARIKK